MRGNDSFTVAQREPAYSRREHEQPKRRFTRSDPLRCPRCGLALHAGVIEHEQALVFASCCPRCDGPLPMHEATVNPTQYDEL
jgi:hypothetical protein